MHDTMNTTDKDAERMAQWLKQSPDTESVAQFHPNEHIDKLDLKFDIDLLREGLTEALTRTDWQGPIDQGFGAFSLTRLPGVEVETANDLSGRFYTRPDDTYEEVPREDIVDEGLFTEFTPTFAGTYFEHVHSELSKRFPIGRMRVLSKATYNCNSWHRDPEPRLHIPIHTNPGALFIVNHYCTHLPADGSVYFTDTRGYHTALNGGEQSRVHIVAALPMGTV